MIDMRNFYSNLLKIDKKSHRDIDIYYIGYITIKKYIDCENIHSVNHLYLIIHSATGYVKEKNSEKYLIIDSTEKYEEVFLELNQKLKQLIVEKNCFMKKNYSRIGVNTDHDLPLNASLKFLTLTVIIRCVFQKGSKFYLQIYLDEYLYEL